MDFVWFLNCAMVSFYFFLEEIFFKIFFPWCGPFLKSLLNLLQYCFCCLRFGFLAARHVGSELPDQGSNPHPLHWKAKSQPLDHQESPSVPRSLTSWHTLPSCKRHPASSHLVAKLTLTYISSLNLYISFLKKLSMNLYSMLGPLAKASQTSLCFSFNDVDDNNYDCNDR